MLVVWQQMFLMVLACCTLFARNVYSFPHHYQAIVHLNLKLGFAGLIYPQPIIIIITIIIIIIIIVIIIIIIIIIISTIVIIFIIIFINAITTFIDLNTFFIIIKFLKSLYCILYNHVIIFSSYYVNMLSCHQVIIFSC